MAWFRGIEGARAWLAWTVVLSHIVQFLALPNHIPRSMLIARLGDVAVNIFIIISGFVITHLILEKKEPYGTYIFRRFMRIYPLYFTCLLLSLISTRLYYAAVFHSHWGSDIPFTNRMGQEMAAAIGSAFPAQLLAHLTLLHGVISSNVLFESEYTFLSPAWSLSLEWQFYLVAPLVIWSLRDQLASICVSLLSLILFYCYKKGYFGSFILPSFLPGAVFQFAVGIMTRIGISKVPAQARYPLAALIIWIGIMHSPYQVHYVIWAALVGYMVMSAPVDRVNRYIHSVLDMFLNSNAANWMGRRSYSVYLIHVPVIQSLLYTCGNLAHLGYWLTVAVVALLTPVFTLAAADLLYRHVEVCGIAVSKGAFGKSRAHSN